LFSFISLEWAGHPLRSLQLMMSYIEGTTTKTTFKSKRFSMDGSMSKARRCPMNCSKRFPYLDIRNCLHGTTRFVPTEDKKANLLCAAAKTGGRMIAP
ncbi:MAG: hypothetical protein DMG49_04125, partial [Acidobacteria bacterium]